jgi:hypothetical protein
MRPVFLLCCIALKAADLPGLSARDIINAADRSAGKVAPGEIVVLFPSNAGPELLTPYRLIDGKITNELSETRVWFDGIPAPINYFRRVQRSPLGARRAACRERGSGAVHARFVGQRPGRDAESHWLLQFGP